ncbi:MAG: FtsX-like permease family protein, partial [Candidatus Thioglobus sp.]
FHKELRDRVLSTISHSYISGYNGSVKNWQQLQAKIEKHPQVVSASPYIQKYALINNSFGAQGISVRGIVPELEKNTSAVMGKIKSGSANLDKSSILIGAGLASKLGTEIGDKITLITPQLSSNILGVQPKFKRFTITGIFDAGVAEYDNNLAFIQLHQTQLLYAMKGKVSGIRLKVDDIFNAKKITREVVKNIGSEQYYGVDWSQQKANFIQALNLEKQMIGVILSLIIAVATFNVVSMMIMVVTNKKADIAILRTIGMTPKRIVKIFFYQGISIGIIGIIVGVIFGIALALNIEEVVGVIELLLGFEFFPKDVFYINSFPSEIHLSDVLIVVISAFILVVIAAIYPAKRAGKLQISEVLNYE